jgi:hypothetical protein
MILQISIPSILTVFAVAVILTNAFLAYRGRAKGSMKMLILSVLAAGATIVAAVENEASAHFLRAIVGG